MNCFGRFLKQAKKVILSLIEIVNRVSRKSEQIIMSQF